MKNINNETIFITFFNKNLIKIFIMHFLSVKKAYGNNFKYLIGTDEETINKFSSFFKENNIHAKNVEKSLDIFKNNKLLNEKHSVFTMARLITFDIFPELENENFIYIDCDTIVNKPLFMYDGVKSNFAVRKKYNKRHIRRSKKSWNDKLDGEVKKIIFEKFEKKQYFNAGVLIINEPSTFKQLLERCKNSDIRFDDQTILNANNNGEIIPTDYIGNNAEKGNYGRKREVNHLSGAEKPWTKLKWYDFLNKYRFLKVDWKKYYNESEEIINNIINNID